MQLFRVALLTGCSRDAGDFSCTYITDVTKDRTVLPASRWSSKFCACAISGFDFERVSEEDVTTAPDQGAARPSLLSLAVRRFLRLDSGLSCKTCTAERLLGFRRGLGIAMARWFRVSSRCKHFKLSRSLCTACLSSYAFADTLCMRKHTCLPTKFSSAILGNLALTPIGANLCGKGFAERCRKAVSSCTADVDSSCHYRSPIRCSSRLFVFVTQPG